MKIFDNLKRVKLILTCGLVLSVLTLSGCSSEAGPDGLEEGGSAPATRVDIELTQQSQETLALLEDYNLRLLNDYVHHVLKHNDKELKNAVLSPLSVQILFSMLANGVEGDLKTDLFEYMGVDTVHNLNELASELLGELPKVDMSTGLTLSNGGWFSDQKKVTEEFAGILSSDYKADWCYLDYSDPVKACEIINQWVSEHTDRKINKILQILPPNTLFTLANTLCFKAKWNDNLFDENLTAKTVFHGLDGDATVDMMTAPAHLGNYSADGNYCSFQLDFGNGAFRMTVILPNKDSDGDRLEKDVYNALNHYRPVNLTVKLPKFHVKGEERLQYVLENSALKALVDAVPLTMFETEESGKFGIVHSADLEVDEKGCEAAAVTITEWYISPGPGFTPQYEDVTVTVDRPFWFFINERSTGACIMSGKINNL